MAQNEQSVTEDNPNINTNSSSEISSETQKRPFRITVEFPLFFTILSVSLSGAVRSNILLYRTCVHALNYTKEDCLIFLSPVRSNTTQHLEEEVQKYAAFVYTKEDCLIFLSPVRSNTTQHLEEEVQKYAAFVSMVRTIIESVAPAVLSLFLGVWSDKHGRKPLVVWPLLGMSLSTTLVVAYGIMDNLGPWWYILTVIPISVSGGFTALFTGAYCYVSDITSTENRSFRMTVVEAAVSAGSVIGAMSSSYVLKAVGHVYLLAISASLFFVAYAYCVSLKESLQGASQGSMRSVVDFSLLKEIIRQCFKKRQHYGRVQIILLTFANCFSIFILYGLMSLEYLYTRKKLQWALKQYTTYSAVNSTISFFGSLIGVALVQRYLGVNDLVFSIIAFLSAMVEYLFKAFAVVTWHIYLEYLYTRKKLQWALKQYTTYSAVNSTISFFGSLIGVALVQRYLGVNDLVFSIIAFLSAMVEYLFKAFAVVTWHIYLGAGISLFRDLSSPLIRSLLTKMLPYDEIAKVFALMGAIEGVSSLISPALYNSLYAYTISPFPGAIYMLSSGINCLGVLFLGLVQHFRWKATSIISHQNLNAESTSS